MKKFYQILKISSIFSGAILGAGFAGGAELFEFFVSHSKAGIIGAAAAGVLFALLGATILYTAKKYECASFDDFLLLIFKKRTAFLFGKICDVFLLVCFFIMLSGSGALFYEVFALPSFCGSIITAAVVFIVMSTGIDGIGKVCSVLSPMMLVGILFIDIVSLKEATLPAFSQSVSPFKNVAVSSILYVSYNMLTSAPALCESISLAENKKISALGGIFGGVALTLLAVLTSLCLYFAKDSSHLSSLPLLAISKNFGTVYFYMYASVLYMAILTTAFSCGVSLVSKIRSFGLSQKASSLILSAIALPLSLINFSLLVKYCYTFFGYLGLALIFKVFTRFKK